MKLTAAEIQETCSARIRQRGTASHFRHLATDTRRLKKESLFFALHGPRFDGHEFIAQAWQRGASGIVVQKGRKIRGRRGRWIFSVNDPLEALGDAAAAWRRKFDIPVIGITGSNGKTTTKEMVAQLLAKRFHILKTEGNYNNLIGLPLTLGRLNRRHHLAVLEMGMSAPGEIARLCEIARPQIGAITNIARAHLEGLGSLQAIARAKAEMLPGLTPDGLAVLNADDPWVEKLAKQCRTQVIRYGFSATADVRAHNFTPTRDHGCTFEVTGLGSRIPIRLNLPGRHNASNALAAMTIADQYSIPLRQMAESLRHVSLPSGRLQRLRIAGATILNDSYNANPDSVLQALTILRSFPTQTRKIAVLGDMLELGAASRKAHKEIGSAAAEAQVRELIAVGSWAQAIADGAISAGLPISRIHVCDDTRCAADRLNELLKRGDVILLKASRGMRMEDIIEHLQGKRTN